MPGKRMIVENIERLMAEQGFNNASLAAAAGLNHTAIRDIRKGKSQSPKADTVQKIADALNVTVAEPLGDDISLDALRTRLIEEIADLSDSERQGVYAYIAAIKAQRQ